MRCTATRRITKLRGATLLELLMVVLLMGIIAAVATVALREPVMAYQMSQSRAELTDIADGALRRMARDIRLSLPNSVRVNGNSNALELLLTRSGGRYRIAQNDAVTAAGDVLNFAAADTTFDTIGAIVAPPGQGIANGDVLVINNLFADPGITVSNAYTRNADCGNSSTDVNCNSAVISATGAGDIIGGGETKITFSARRFPQNSPGHRFHVVQGPVLYACNIPAGPGNNINSNGDGTGTLQRAAGYNIALNMPAATSDDPLVARYVSACTFTYNPLVLTQSLGLVSIQLTLTRRNENVTLYHEVHVSNIP